MRPENVWISIYSKLFNSTRKNAGKRLNKIKKLTIETLISCMQTEDLEEMIDFIESDAREKTITLKLSKDEQNFSSIPKNEYKDLITIDVINNIEYMAYSDLNLTENKIIENYLSNYQANQIFEKKSEKRMYELFEHQSTFNSFYAFCEYENGNDIEALRIENDHRVKCNISHQTIIIDSLPLHLLMKQKFELYCQEHFEKMIVSFNVNIIEKEDLIQLMIQKMFEENHSLRVLFGMDLNLLTDLALKNFNQAYDKYLVLYH